MEGNWRIGGEERPGYFLSLSAVGISGSGCIHSMAPPFSYSPDSMVPNPTVATAPTRQLRLLGSVKPPSFLHLAQGPEKGNGTGVKMVIGCGSSFLLLFMSGLPGLAFNSS